MWGFPFGAGLPKIVLAVSATAMMVGGGGVVVARQADPAVAETYSSLETPSSVPAEATADEALGSDTAKAAAPTTLRASTTTTSRVVATTNQPVATIPSSAAPGPVSSEMVVTPPVTVARPPRVVVVGDSITVNYSRFMPTAARIGTSGGDAFWGGWAAGLRAIGVADVVVLQDYVVPGSVPLDRWESAWRELVDAAHSVGARKVSILVGDTNAAFLSSLDGTHVTMPPADHPDGVHFTYAGGVRLAALVLRNL